MKTSNVSRSHPGAIIDGWVDPTALRSGDTGGGPTQVQNDSGSDLGVGAVVVLAANGTITTTTTAGDTRPVGVVLDTIADGAFGPVAWSGPVSYIAVDGTVTAAEFAVTSSSAGSATGVAVRSGASFGYFTSSGTTPSGFLFPGGGTPGAAIIFIIDGVGAVITAGIKGSIPIPFACTITAWTLLNDVSGSIVVDIWKDTYANYPPVDADSVTASAPPTVSSATKATSSTLTGWTTAIAAGDVLRFNVDSATSVTMVTLSIHITK